MKKMLIPALAAALLLPTMAVPAMARDDHRPHVVATKTVTYKTFRKGEKFDRHHARHYQEIDYRHYKRLGPPPRGYHYVRSGNDVLLVGITSGIVASVVAGLIH